MLCLTGEDVDLNFYNPYVVADLLKTFLSELPEPILTFHLYDRFIDAARKIQTRSFHPK